MEIPENENSEKLTIPENGNSGKSIILEIENFRKMKISMTGKTLPVFAHFNGIFVQGLTWVNFPPIRN